MSQVLKKEQIISARQQFCEEQDIPAEMLLVAAGAACVLYGVRSYTSDVDVDVPPELFQKLLNSGLYKTHFFGEVLVL